MIMSATQRLTERLNERSLSQTAQRLNVQSSRAPRNTRNQTYSQLPRSLSLLPLSNRTDLCYIDGSRHVTRCHAYISGPPNH